MTNATPALKIWQSRLRQRPLAALSVVVLLTVILAALTAPLLTPYDPNQMDLNAILVPPSSAHWLGTDELGRDIFSRIVHGARPSLLAGFGIVLIGSLFGILIGCLSGLLGCWVDNIIMRFIDVMMALPGLVVALALTAALGPSLFNAVLALGVLSIPAYTRVARGQTLSIREREYVLTARTLGAGTWHLVWRHVLPNVLPPVVIYMTFHLGSAILASSALSFIGLGMQPPDPEWGAIIGSGREYILAHWWYSTFPGLAIIITATSINLLGDALRDWIDPKQR